MAPLGKLLDYSQARPPLTTVRAHGYAGVYRYVCSDRAEAGLPGKRLTPRERDQILAAGLDIGLHGEDDARAALGGYNRGLAQGRQWAEYAHDVLAAPKGMTIVAAIDYDTLGIYPNVVQDYLGGVRDGLQGQYQLGVYGSVYVVTGALQDERDLVGVQTSAWSHGLLSAFAHVYQHGGSEFAGTDYNDVLRIPHGTWLQTLGADMPLTSDDAKTLFNAGVTNPASGATQPFDQRLCETEAAAKDALAMATATHDAVLQLAAAVAQLQPGAGGGPVSGTVSGSLTITPATS
jgi:hypothetical protein